MLTSCFRMRLSNNFSYHPVKLVFFIFPVFPVTKSSFKTTVSYSQQKHKQTKNWHWDRHNKIWLPVERMQRYYWNRLCFASLAWYNILHLPYPNSQFANQKPCLLSWRNMATISCSLDPKYPNSQFANQKPCLLSWRNMATISCSLDLVWVR